MGKNSITLIAARNTSISSDIGDNSIEAVMDSDSLSLPGNRVISQIAMKSI